MNIANKKDFTIAPTGRVVTYKRPMVVLLKADTEDYKFDNDSTLENRVPVSIAVLAPNAVYGKNKTQMSEAAMKSAFISIRDQEDKEIIKDLSLWEVYQMQLNGLKYHVSMGKIEFSRTTLRFGDDTLPQNNTCAVIYIEYLKER